MSIAFVLYVSYSYSIAWTKGLSWCVRGWLLVRVRALLVSPAFAISRLRNNSPNAARHTVHDTRCERSLLVRVAHLTYIYYVVHVISLHWWKSYLLKWIQCVRWWIVPLASICGSDTPSLYCLRTVCWTLSWLNWTETECIIRIYIYINLYSVWYLAKKWTLSWLKLTLPSSDDLLNSLECDPFCVLSTSTSVLRTHVQSVRQYIAP